MTPSVETLGTIFAQIAAHPEIFSALSRALTQGVDPVDLERRLFDAIEADSKRRFTAALKEQSHENR